MRLIGLFLLLSSNFFAQIDSLKVIYTLPVSDEVVWTADVIGNLYAIEKDVLVKYDTTGQKRYSQSIKSLGRITQVECQSSMRIWLFSKDQQTLSVADNTLSSHQESFDLNELGYEYVTLFCTSAQANKLWVYDEVNSTLVFHDFVRNEKRAIENLKGTLRCGRIVQMKEIDNQLYLLDDENRIFVIDRFGSLIDSYSLPISEKVFWLRDKMVLLQGNSLYLWEQSSKEARPIYPELIGVESMRFEFPNLFVKTSKKLTKYQYK